MVTSGAVAVYAAMIGLTLAAFLGIRALGTALEPGGEDVGAHPIPAHAPLPGPGDALYHVLLAMLAVVVTARVLGSVMRRVGQPRVVGELVAGLLLGPSFLGRVAPGLASALLPPVAVQALGVLSQVGVVLFMFLVGLELDPRSLRERSHASIAISHASIVVPFLLGSALALWLYPGFSPAGVSFGVFALFIGVAMSITAFPVLARILTDRGMQATRVGVMALTCAAVDDVTAWCLLALLVGVVRARPEHAVVTAGLGAAFVALLLLVVRPLAVRLVRTRAASAGREEAVAVLLVALLAASLSTELIGLHAIFGAFLLGVVVPHDSELARRVRLKLEDVTTVLLLPAFFALTGLRTELGLLDSPLDWLTCAAIIAVASLGKVGGCLAAGRLTGLDWRSAASLAILMNTRGLVELIVLNVGLELGVVSRTLFTMLVLMAAATTFATSPLLSLLARVRPAIRARAEATDHSI
jgi:Kef-type K+ transport system membrane component KefB